MRTYGSVLTSKHAKAKTGYEPILYNFNNMINKIKDIPNGTEVWVKMRRERGDYDDKRSLRFDIMGDQ